MASKTQRYNNPLALIQKKPDKWVGLTGSINGFLSFDTVENGIRAGIINLHNTYFKRGLLTPEQIIPIYAPDSITNNGNNYIKFFGKYGINPNTVINDNNIVNFILGICEFEAGYQFVHRTQVENELKKLDIPFEKQTNLNFIWVIFLILLLLTVKL